MKTSQVLMICGTALVCFSVIGWQKWSVAVLASGMVIFFAGHFQSLLLGEK